jgi:hypothetical protein
LAAKSQASTPMPPKENDDEVILTVGFVVASPRIETSPERKTIPAAKSDVCEETITLAPLGMMIVEKAKPSIRKKYKK